jgi:VWFA-related protein
MNATTGARWALTLSMVFSLWISYPPKWIPFLAPSSVLAQQDDASASQKPPLNRPRPKATEDEEEKPGGKTAISVAVDLVSLQVLVTDNKGNVLTGLKPENFTIYEDNVKQEIQHFSPVDANITVVLLTEYSKKVNRYEVWDALTAFTQSLRKGDWIAVMAYDMHTTILSDFTQDRQKIYDALKRLSYPSWNESNLADAMIDALDRTQEIEGKVAIVLISTGLDTFSRHTYDEALAQCKKANASVYAVGLGQWVREYADARGMISSSDNLDYLMGDNRLRSFSELTGGMAYFPKFPTELPSIFGNISELLRSQYSIAYSSSNTQKDGKFRKIRVEVTTDLTDSKGKPLKLKVVTRKGYIPKEI